MKLSIRTILSSVSRSYVCLGLVALILCDVGARVTHQWWPLDPYVSPNRSAIWWATNDFRANAQRPDVMLMGSSLMMLALHGGDATYLNFPQNVALHHRCSYLEHMLTKKARTPVSTFAFAQAGQMPSDAYVLASTLFHGEKKPKTVVYGIAPRDFVDNTIRDPASTETFRYIERIGDLSKISLSARSAVLDQAEWAAGRLSFLYQRRPEFVYLQNHYARQLLKQVCGTKDLEFIRTPIPLRRLALLELPEDGAANDVMTMPHGAQAITYTDNLPEYRRRYRTFKPKTFSTQLSYLERLLKYCSSEGIEVVLVNMPLTPDNVQLMPNGIYNLYMSSINKLAVQNGATVLDFQDPTNFPKEFFLDSCHLNGLGGKHFFEVLAERLPQRGSLALSRTKRGSDN